MTHDARFEMGAPPSGLRVVQLIVFALFLGLVTFAAIVQFAPPGAGRPIPGPGFDTVRYVAIGLGVAMAPVAIFARHFLMRTGLAGAEPDEEMLMQRLLVGTIMGSALLEGPALFLLIVYLQARNPIDLAVAALPTTLLLVVMFPTTDRWFRYVRSFGERAMGRAMGRGPRS